MGENDGLHSRGDTVANPIKVKFVNCELPKLDMTDLDLLTNFIVRLAQQGFKEIIDYNRKFMKGKLSNE